MIKKLYIKNSLGFHHGLGISEMRINFEKQFNDSSIIAILGENGRGKSTILDFLHPYKDNFLRDPMAGTRGKENFAENFKDGTGEKFIEYDLEGDIYSFKIEITKKKAKCSIYKNNVSVLSKGTIEQYNEKVIQIFGEKDIFSRTHFRNGKASYLCNMREADQRKYFLKVLGIEKYSRLKEFSKEESKKYEKLIKELKQKITDALIESSPLDLQNAEVLLLKLFNKIEKKRKIIEELHDLIVKNEIQKSNIKAFEDSVKELEEKQREYEKKIESNDENIEHYKISIDESNKAIDDIKKTIKFLKEEKDKYNKEYNELKENLKQKDKIYKLYKKKEKLDEEKTKIAQDIQSLTPDIKKYNLILTDINSIKNKIKNLKEYVDARDSSILDGIDLNELCENCTIKIQIQIDHIKDEIDEEIKIKIEGIENFRNKLNNETNGLYVKEKDYKERIIAPHDLLLEKLANLEIHSSKIPKDISKQYKNIIECRLTFSSLERKRTETGLNIKHNEEEIKNKEKNKQNLINSLNETIKRGDDLKNELKEIEEKLKKDLSKDVLDLVELKEKQKDLEIEKTALESEKTICVKNINRIKEKQECAKKLEKEKMQYETEKYEWDLLCDVYNEKTGVPIILLEDAIPKIEKEANHLLKEMYDIFSLKFQIYKKDAKGNDIYSFNISMNRHDSTLGATPIEKLSDGEKAIVESTIALATIIYMQLTSNRIVSMMMMDECDGSLDNNNIVNYYKMIKIAHERAKCKQTIFITHDADALPPNISKFTLDPKFNNGYEIEVTS